MESSSQDLAATATAVVTEASLSQNSNNESNQCSERSKNSAALDVKSLKELKFISWNVDGLSERDFILRTKAVANIILKEEADVVFLQEVVPASAAYFSKRFTNYECLFGNDDGYFSGIFLKKPNIKLESHNIIEFPNTTMMRNILKANVHFGHVPLCLMNVHLESTMKRREERKNQLRISFDEIRSIPENRCVLYAGDMNLRDIELAEIGGLPSGIQDVWIMLGSPESCAYTWDTSRNFNLMYSSDYDPKHRFDRVFFRDSSPPKLTPKLIDLIGLNQLLPYRSFPSDHWGILNHFSIE